LRDRSFSNKWSQVESQVDEPQKKRIPGFLAEENIKELKNNIYCPIKLLE